MRPILFPPPLLIKISRERRAKTYEEECTRDCRRDGFNESHVFLAARENSERSKYRKAKQLKTEIIDEDDLFEMLRKSNPHAASSGSGSGSGSTPKAAAAATTGAGGGAGASGASKVVISYAMDGVCFGARVLCTRACV